MIFWILIGIGYFLFVVASLLFRFAFSLIYLAVLLLLSPFRMRKRVRHVQTDEKP